MFSFQPGPVMTNILLADEINRTIPRTQSSLLESMEERQVTIDGETRKLPEPFFVIATQNPIELAGTFPLPEAQLDRFLLRTHVGYPEKLEALAILERFQRDDPRLELTAVAAPDEITAMRRARAQIKVSAPVREYIVDLVDRTRRHPAVQLGASPRGSLSLMRAGQALAALRGRDYVLPDDVKYLALPVLGHRLIVRDVERLRGITEEQVVEDILREAHVPIAGGTS